MAMIEAGSTSETSEKLFQATRRENPDEGEPVPSNVAEQEASSHAGVM